MKYCEKCLAKNGNFGFCVRTLQTSCGAIRQRKRVTSQTSFGGERVISCCVDLYFVAFPGGTLDLLGGGLDSLLGGGGGETAGNASPAPGGVPPAATSTSSAGILDFVALVFLYYRF